MLAVPVKGIESGPPVRGILQKNPCPTLIVGSSSQMGGVPYLELTVKAKPSHTVIICEFLVSIWPSGVFVRSFGLRASWLANKV